MVRMGERRGMYRVLVGKSERKRPFGRPKRRWDYNIINGSSGSEIGGGRYGLDRAG